MTTQDVKWLISATMDYFRALDGNTSDLAIAREKFQHGIESLVQREYHRGYDDGRMAAGKEG